MGDYVPPLRMQPEQYPTYPCRFCNKDDSAYWRAHEELLHCSNCDAWFDDDRRWSGDEVSRLKTLLDRYFESLPRVPVTSSTFSGSMLDLPESNETKIIKRALKRLREDG
ncbi:MAG: hypothetical protein KAJ01_05995 [Candidatus Hydrogenedentes bacterium]|nr:hypothetical protein [Candidatus Hydrogenedentota bacterium]